MKASQYVPIHSKQIRGLSFNRQNDSLLLSAALDNTIKLTRYLSHTVTYVQPHRWSQPVILLWCLCYSLLTNTVVQTYNTGKPVWSCCWSLDHSNYVYAGLSNGSVLVYDTRDTSTHVQELEPLRSRYKHTHTPTSTLWQWNITFSWTPCCISWSLYVTVVGCFRCPVASLCYIPRAVSNSFPCGGLIAGSLEGGCFWEHVNETSYRPNILPLESAGCTDIQVEPESRHCLVTYRPGKNRVQVEFLKPIFNPI